MGFVDGSTIISAGVSWLNTGTPLFDGFSTLQFLEALVYFSFCGMCIGRIMRGKRYVHGIENEEATEDPDKAYEQRENIDLTLDEAIEQEKYSEWT